MKTKFEDVVKAKPEMIYYSAGSVWWTHRPEDLQKGPVPLDIFGSPLLQVPAKVFLDKNAIINCSTYGKNPIRNLMLCHHDNIEWLRQLDGFERKMRYLEVGKLIDSTIGVDEEP